jgi:hypothetical protein
MASPRRLLRHPEAPRDDVAWDPWDALGIHCGGYSSSVDDQLLAVMRAVRDGARRSRAREDGPTNFVRDVARVTGLGEDHVELVQYILCSADLCDYGVSPRGAWPIDDKLDEFIARFERYYEERWTDGPEA